MTDLPPFLAGQQAAQDGRSRHANPHPKRDEREPGDGYPGPYHNWLDGWRHARQRMQFDAALRGDKPKETPK